MNEGNESHISDISLHILDIAVNSVEAGATVIEIVVEEQYDSLRLTIKDNGCGMSNRTLCRAAEAGFTTKKSKSRGMGLFLLKEASESFSVKSEIAKGTVVNAVVGVSSARVGDIAQTILVLLGTVNADIIYSHSRKGRSFVFDTADIRRQIGDVDFKNPAIAYWVKNMIDKSLLEIKQL